MAGLYISKRGLPIQKIPHLNHRALKSTQLDAKTEYYVTRKIRPFRFTPQIPVYSGTFLIKPQSNN